MGHGGLRRGIAEEEDRTILWLAGIYASLPTGEWNKNVRGQRRKSMTTTAQNVKYHRQLAKLEASRRNPDKVKMLPRERIRIKRRCNLCGRARAVYRKFGICRICFRNMASDGLIPGVKKASW